MANYNNNPIRKLIRRKYRQALKKLQNYTNKRTLPMLVYWGLGGKLYTEHQKEWLERYEPDALLKLRDGEDYTCSNCGYEPKNKMIFRINWTVKKIRDYAQFCSMDCFREYMGYPP